MLTIAVFGWLLAGVQSAPAGGVIGVETFDGEASIRAWSFHNGPEFPGAVGRIAWEGRDGHARPGCLALHHGFAGGGNYVQATWSLPENNSARRLRCWLKKPGGHRLTFRAVDSAGQTFQKSIEYTYPDWQQVEVNLTTWGHSFGGPGDGRCRPPIRQLGVLIENTSEPRDGVLWIDDLELLADAEDPGTSSAITYVASDFASGPSWGASGGPGNQLDARAWHYQFNDGAGVPSLHTAFSLLGHPRVLRLIVDSDGSGHGVHVRIGSHFQQFYRQVGQLAERGEQVLEVPMGDMSGWRFEGGQNDGQVRLPLRVLDLHLERSPTGPARGTLALKRLEVDTSSRGMGPVVLLPDTRYDEGERQVHFAVELRNLRPIEVQGRLVCDCRSLGERIAREVVEMKLPGDGRPVTRAFHYAVAPHHFVEAEFQWIEPGFVSPPTGIGMSTLPEDPGSPVLDPASPMGVGLYLYRFRGHPQAHEMMVQAAALAQRAGVKWTREEILWHLTEPRPGQYDWAFYDDLLEVAMGHGVSVYGLLDYWAEHAPAYTEEGVEQYCRWVGQVVRRYKSRIKHWEIWNEPNIFFWSGPKELYARLLARAYEVIKAEDPQAQVLGCSTSGIDVDFIRKVMAWGGRFDALTIHPYRGVLDDVAYIEELRAVRNLVDGRPVWITEIGFPSQLLDGYSERRQASLVARVYLASVASGAIASVSWYDFRNDGSDPFYNEMNFGMVREDFRPKPAYRALATVARTLAGLKVKERIEVGPRAYAFRFGDGQHDTVAVCAPAGGGVLTFETNADVAILNGMGEPVEPVRDRDRVTCTLDPGFPVYVRSRAGFAFKPTEPAVRLEFGGPSVRAGQAVELRISPVVEVLSWDLPYGWPEPSATRPGVYLLKIPEVAATGDVVLQAVMRRNGQAVRVPAALSVQPALIRI